MGTITYPLSVEEKKWEMYKETVPRSKTLGEDINEMIDDRIEEHYGEDALKGFEQRGDE